MEKDRIDVIIMGRKLGTATGYDLEGTGLVFYDFFSDDGIDLPSGDTWFLFDKGIAGVYDNNGIMEAATDLVPVLAKIERTEDKS